MKPDDGACRRRRAAFELRSRASHVLDQAHRLDGLPAMRLLRSDVEGSRRPSAWTPNCWTDIHAHMGGSRDRFYPSGDGMRTAVRGDL